MEKSSCICLYGVKKDYLMGFPVTQKDRRVPNHEFTFTCMANNDTNRGSPPCVFMTHIRA